MDPEEEVGESSPPERTSPPNRFVAYDAKNDLYERLLKIGNVEVTGNPQFREQFDAHFKRFPKSYVSDISMGRVEDVLLHQKMLDKAREPENRPVLHIRFLENVTRSDHTEEESISSHSSDPMESASTDNKEAFPTCERQDSFSSLPIHEVVFSTIDKPRLLSEFCSLLSNMGLNIREAHAYNTIDGYSLDLFVVDGWLVEDTDGLTDAMLKAIAGNESSAEKATTVEAIFGDWELDRELIEMGVEIASGSFGVLYHGVYNGQDVAIKVLKSENFNKTLEDEYRQEIFMLSKVEHENVVRFIGACTKSPPLLIVTEYMPGGSLYDFLRKDHIVLKLSQRLRFAIDICKGMEYLHEKNIIHRDLKTPNLLLDGAEVVKVADLGLARFQHLGGVMTGETGTYRWMAPEVLTSKEYDMKADVYSFAIVLWELLTAKLPYEHLDAISTALLVVREELRPELPKDAHPKLLNLMQRCWETIPANRPSFPVIRVELEKLLEDESKL